MQENGLVVREDKDLICSQIKGSPLYRGSSSYPAMFTSVVELLKLHSDLFSPIPAQLQHVLAAPEGHLSWGR